MYTTAGPYNTSLKDGLTMLHGLATNGVLRHLQVILQRGDLATEELDSTDSKGRTPLYLAADSGHEEVVRILLATGKVKPDTALFPAAKNGYTSIVQLLLATGKISLGSLDSHDESPLSLAAQNGHVS